MSSAPAPTPAPRRLIAPWYHTLIFLLILAGLAWWGNHLNKTSPPGAGGGTDAQPHSQAWAYLVNSGGEWLMILFIWAGVNDRQGLRGLTGGRWTSWKQAATDFAIAAPFWVLWTATARITWYLIGPSHEIGRAHV